VKGTLPVFVHCIRNKSQRNIDFLRLRQLFFGKFDLFKASVAESVDFYEALAPASTPIVICKLNYKF
jgi:hypothetical protein